MTLTMPEKNCWLRQEYFFTSAGIQSIVRHYRRTHNSMAGFAERVAIHINDTHPAMAIPELMRVLMDDEHVSWNEAWRITLKGYELHQPYVAIRSAKSGRLICSVVCCRGFIKSFREIDRRFRLAFVPQFGQTMIDRIAPLGNGRLRMAYFSNHIGSLRDQRRGP